MIDDPARRLIELREAFDHSFAALPPASAEPGEGYLAIRINGNPYALRAIDVSGIRKTPPLVPLPGRRGDCLGLAGLDGAIVPVFSLAALLGYAREEAPGRWIALCHPAEPLAFAFDTLEGYRSVPAAAVVSRTDVDAAKAEGGQALALEEGIRYILDLARFVEAILKATPPAS